MLAAIFVACGSTGSRFIVVAVTARRRSIADLLEARGPNQPSL
jgi:hypothetical protein